MPNNIQPYQQSIDMGLPQIFSCQVNGNIITDYDLVIKSLDNVVQYDSGKTTLITPLYNLQQLNIPVDLGTSAFKGQLKQIITYYNGAESVSSGEMIFTNLITPSVTDNIPDIISSSIYTMNVTYSQAESVPVKKWNIELFDYKGVSLQTSGDIYSGLIQYELDGLANNQNYYVNISIETQSQTGMGLTTDIRKDFLVQYDSLDLGFKPILTQIEDKSAIKIDWSLLSQNPGVISGTSLYQNNFLRDNNEGLALDKGSTLNYDNFVLPANFTMSFLTQLPKDFSGIIFQTTDENYKLGYDNVGFANDVDIAYTGAWTIEDNGGYHNRVARYSIGLNNNATCTFTGTGMNAHFIQSEHMGKAEIFVDDVSYGIIDLYKDATDNTCPTTQISTNIYTRQYTSAETWDDISTKTWDSISTSVWSSLAYKHVYFSINNLALESHTVKINVLGTKNILSDSNKVELEYFEILNTGVIDTTDNGTDNRFYTIIQGVTKYSEIIKISEKPFEFILFPDHVLMKQYNIYRVWNNISAKTWDEITDFTWDFMSE